MEINEAKKIEFEKEEIFKYRNLRVNKYINEKKDIGLGISFKYDNVVIMPYTVDAYGRIEKVGVLNEFNPNRNNNHSMTLITGTMTSTDETDFETAKRELFEESGYDIQDDDRWDYLGEITMAKFADVYHPCYIVDITGTVPKKVNIDLPLKEQLSTFSLEDIANVLRKGDSYILTMIMKFYIYFYNSSFLNSEGIK